MDRRGSVLVSVLLVISFALLLGVPVMYAAQTEHKAAINDQMDAQAFYLAEAGMEDCRATALAYLQEEAAKGWTPGEPLTTFGDGWFKDVQRDEYGPGDYHAYAYLVERDGSYSIEIKSEGYVGGTAGLSKGTEISFPIVTDGSGGGSGGTGGGGGPAIPLDMALFASDGLSMNGSPSVVGSTITNSVDDDTVDLGWSTYIQGDLTIGPGASADDVIKLPNWCSLGSVVSGTIRNLQVPRAYPEAKMPSTPVLATKNSIRAAWNPDPPYFIRQDGYYPTIDVKSELRIEVGSGERIIHTRSLSISGDGKLVVVGSGKLTIFVDETFDIAGSGGFNVGGSPEKVNIYYKGTKDFSLTGAGVFNGMIQTTSADVKVAGSGRMAGSIITNSGDVDLSGAGAVGVTLVYAPQSQLKMSGSAKVTGAVICKHAIMSGSADIIYDGSVSPIYNGIVGTGGSVIDFGGQLWKPVK